MRSMRLSRRAISLMEVLISIGVISIGLLGVVSLIPVASQQAEQGARNDRRANVGRRSFREFGIRQLNETKNWHPYHIDNMNGPIRQRAVIGPTPDREFRPQPICIDPRFVGATNNAPTGVASTADAFVNRHNLARFRFGRSSSAFGMTVVSLDNGNGVAQTMATPPMTSLQADEIFVFQDDLEFEPPAKNGDSPTQTFLKVLDPNDNTQQLDAKRYARGQFSWFATLVPDLIRGEIVLGPGGGYEWDYTDWWTLSTVICFQRNDFRVDAMGNRMGVFEGTISDAVPSSNGSTSGFYTGGEQGGDVRISWPTTMTEFPKSGDWILLGQEIAEAQRFQWYQVKFSAGSDPDNAGFQDLTIQGADWPLLPTYVTWMPEVVSVYSKRIQIVVNH